MRWRTLKGERIEDVQAFVGDNAGGGQNVHETSTPTRW
jgi:hypothetical protein